MMNRNRSITTHEIQERADALFKETQEIMNNISDAFLHTDLTKRKQEVSSAFELSTISI